MYLLFERLMLYYLAKVDIMYEVYMTVDFLNLVVYLGFCLRWKEWARSTYNGQMKGCKGNIRVGINS